MATNRWSSTIIGQQEQLDTLLSRLGTASGADLATDIGTVDGIVDDIVAGTYGITPAVAESKKLYGALSEDGAASNLDIGGEDHSTPTFFSYNLTATSYITRLVLFLENGDFTSDAAMDTALFLGGASAIDAGFSVAVNDAGTVATPTYESEVANTIEEFATLWGAEVFRHTQDQDASASADNHDTLIVIYDFVKILGAPLLCADTDYVGVICDGDFSAVTKITGAVFGRIA